MQSTIIMAFIRHILGFFGGTIAGNGWASSDDVNTLIGAVMTVVALVWSIFEKRAKPAA